MNTAEHYIRLAHAIERHNPGYIDGYFGADSLKETETRPLESLTDEAAALAAEVETLTDESRRTFLGAQVRAMQTSIRLLQGEPLPYAEEVRLLYDIEAQKVPEKVFEAAIRSLDDLLPGGGSIAEREQRYRRAFEVPPERLPGLLEAIRHELRERTLKRFSLPDDESFTVELVKDKPWSGYNWYLGNNRSRIDINTDLPSLVTDLPDLIAHEAYPGHHTEHAIKEQKLVKEAGRLEHTLLLINAPECVVSEGIAVRALKMVMSDDEVRDWLENDLLERAGLKGLEVSTMSAIKKAKANLRAVTGNAAFMLHDEGQSEAEVRAYLETYRLATPAEAKKSLSFITHPNFRSYIFTYTAGGELLDKLFEGGDAGAYYKRLLEEPVTPSTIRAWLEA